MMNVKSIGAVFFLSFTAANAQVELITPRIMDLGRVDEGTVIRENIRLVNKAGERINILTVKTSCGCTVPELDQTSIAPGDTAVIPFSFNTKGFFGTVRKILTVVFEEREIPAEKITIQVTPFSEVELEPRYIYLQRIKQNADTLITRPLSIKNHSAQVLRIVRIQTDNTMVRVTPDNGTAKPDESVSFNITIKPSQSGYRHARIVITTDHPVKSRLEIPVFLYIL